MTQLPSRLAPMSRLLAASLVFTLAAGYLTVILSPQSGILKGNSDFLDCYTAARIISDGKAGLLYDVATQTAYQQKILEELESDVKFAGGVLLYTHPPFAALLYWPLSRLSYAEAFLAWNLLSIMCLGLCLLLLYRQCELSVRPDPIGLALAVLAFLPIFIAIAQGQNTFLAMLATAGAILCLEQKKDLAGGVSLSLALVKFQFVPLFLAIALLKKRWRMLAGFIAGTSLLVGVSFAVYGVLGMRQYFSLLIKLPSLSSEYGFALPYAYCIRGQMYALLHPAHPAMAATSTVAINLALSAAVLWAWRGRWKAEGAEFNIRMALTIIVALLIGPLANFHDLSFLVLAGFFIHRYYGRGSHLKRWQPFNAAPFRIVAYLLPLVHFIVRARYPLHPMVWGMLMLAGQLMLTVEKAQSPRPFRRLDEPI